MKNLSTARESNSWSPGRPNQRAVDFPDQQQRWSKVLSQIKTLCPVKLLPKDTKARVFPDKDRIYKQGIFLKGSRKRHQMVI